MPCLFDGSCTVQNDVLAVLMTPLKAPKCVHGIRLAGTVNNAGKIGVPTEILSKPGKLRGEQIRFETHILSVADVIMSSHHPCHPGLRIEKARMEIEANRGVLYDAQAVKPVWGYSGNGGLRSIRHIEETDAMDDIPRSVCRDPIRPHASGGFSAGGSTGGSAL